MARMEPWASIWQTADRDPGRIFAAPVTEWTADQKTLVTVTRILDKLRSEPEEKRGNIDELETWEDVQDVLKALQEGREGEARAHAKAHEHSYSRYSVVERFE